MTSVLVDTNVLIDVFGPPNPFLEWSARQLATLKGHAQLVLTPVVWAELASMRPSEADLAKILAPLDFVREALPFSAAYEAGRAHVDYRKRGGLRERTLPDFFIGAHALVKSHRLLTRDPQRYRGYFPKLDIISPEESHS
jgi:predicted nucleic acid-binding protein